MPFLRNLDDEDEDGAGWRYADVDLKPMMAIICILIPLLIFAFSFYEIKVQPVAAPKVGFSGVKGASAVAQEDQKTPLNLTVLITEKGFAIKQTAELAGADSDMRIEKKNFVSKEGDRVVDYDYPGLYAKLAEIKKKFPDETSINIGAEPDVAWEYVCRTIDAARVQLSKSQFASLQEYAEAGEARDDKGVPLLLFPQVVFVVAE